MSETLLNGRYKLVAQQGSGGMAVIYKAVDQELGRTVAIKILRPSLTHDPEFLKRFRNEARNVANLTHPNIVTVYDVGQDNSTHFMVMEFIDGSDLKKLIRKEGVVSPKETVNMGIQICAGIGFAHRAGLVHADVKPQNVLLTSERQVKVTDFGIAQAFSEQTAAGLGERQNVVWGSPHYFAPEQAQGKKPSPASDVYAIGIVLFEMLTGQLPYAGNSQQELAMAHIKEPIPNIRDINPQIPEELARIVYKVMSKEPAGRYRMADQLGKILEAYRDQGEQHTAYSPRVPQQQVPPPPIPRPENRYQNPASQPNVQQPQQNRPLYTEPPQAEPTQRYNVVPEAPGNEFVRNAVPAATPPPAQYNIPASDGTGASAPVMAPYDAAYATTAGGNGLDAITLILAFLAFVAVACLIPLYILVIMAYRG